jgi:hypothetical protein
MSTGMFSTSSNVVHNNQLGEGGNVGAAGGLQIPCYNNGQKERLCLIIDKCRRQKLCKRAQKISAAAPLRVMASRYNPCE